MDQRKHSGRLLGVGSALQGFLHVCEKPVCNMNMCLQTLCECALSSPYNSLKLGMLAVLSTLSGTIAIKQYFSNITGAVCIYSALSSLVCVGGKEQQWADLYSSHHSGSSSVPPRLTDLVKLAQECCYHSNLAVAAHGVIVLTNIAISCPEKGWLLQLMA